MNDLIILQQKRLINVIAMQLQGAIDDANEALESALTDGSEGIYQGRLELAEHLLELINTNEELDSIDRGIQGASKWTCANLLAIMLLTSMSLI